MIRDQMGNTIRYFTWKHQQWVDRAQEEKAKSAGHIAFAYQQAAMWKALGEKAEKKFKSDAN